MCMSCMSDKSVSSVEVVKTGFSKVDCNPCSTFPVHHGDRTPINEKLLALLPHHIWYSQKLIKHSSEFEQNADLGRIES